MQGFENIEMQMRINCEWNGLLETSFKSTVEKQIFWTCFQICCFWRKKYVFGAHLVLSSRPFLTQKCEFKAHVSLWMQPFFVRGVESKSRRNERWAEALRAGSVASPPLGPKAPPLCIDSKCEVVELTLATKMTDVLHLAHRAQLSILSKLKIQ